MHTIGLYTPSSALPVLSLAVRSHASRKARDGPYEQTTRQTGEGGRVVSHPPQCKSRKLPSSCERNTIYE